MSDCLQLHGLQQARFPFLRHLLEFAQTRDRWVGDAIQPLHPLSSPLLLPSIFPSIRVFSDGLALHVRWPKYWSFGFSISPSNQYSGLISFRIDWFDVFAVQGTLRSLLQYHSSKALVLQCSAFFMVQLSHLYMTSLWKDCNFINIYYHICANCMKDGHLWTVVILKWRNSNIYQLLWSSVAFCWSLSPTWKPLSLSHTGFHFFICEIRELPNLLWYSKAVIGFLSIYLSQFNSAKMYRIYTICQLSCKVLGYGND